MNLKQKGKRLKRLLGSLLVLLLAAVMAFGCVGSVGAAGDQLTARVEKALGEVVVYNTYTAVDLANELKSKLGSSYNVSVSDWVISRAVGGCKDQTGTLFEGYEGFASGTATVSGGGDSVKVPFTITVKPTIMTYNFASEAKADYFYPDPDSDGEFLRGDVAGRAGEYFLLSSDGKNLIGYCGEAEKIVMPEGIETMDQSWWLDTDLDAVRCIILPDSLKILPDQFGVPFKNIEVIIMGDNVTKAEGWHTFWKCFYLKHLRLSDNLENLTEEALFETISLTELRLPSKLKKVGKGALHLSALREIVLPVGVEYIDQEAFAWPLRKADYISEGVRTQGNAVPKSITNALEPYLAMHVFDARGEIITRVITVLSPDTGYEQLMKSFWSTGYSWSPINVRYIPESSTELLKNSGYSPEAVTYIELDMKLSEVKGRVANALQTVPLNKDTKAEDIADYVKKALYAKELKGVEVKDYKFTAATKDSAGLATATVKVTYGNETVDIKMNRSLAYHAKFTIGDKAPEGVETDNSSNSNDFLSAVISTDKDSYKTNEDIKVKLDLTNIGALNLDNVRVTFSKSSGLLVKKGTLTPTEYTLTAGEVKQHSVVTIKKQSLGGLPEWINNIGREARSVIPQLGDRPLVLIISLIAAALSIAAVCVFGKKLFGKRIRTALVCFIAIAALAIPIVHINASSERLTVSKRISVDGERYVISATVSYTLSEEATDDRDNNYTVNWDKES